ncbi:alpha/beta hydrolase [Streptomyces sp. NPDC055709]
MPNGEYVPAQQPQTRSTDQKASRIRRGNRLARIGDLYDRAAFESDPANLRKHTQRAGKEIDLALAEWQKEEKRLLSQVPHLLDWANELEAGFDDETANMERERLVLHPDFPKKLSTEDRFRSASKRNWSQCLKDLKSEDKATQEKAALVGKALRASGGSCSLLVYEPGTEKEYGRAAAAVGNMETADYVAIMVPGMGSSLKSFAELVHHAGNLRRECLRASPGAKVAVVAWVGYKAPQNFTEAAWEEPARLGSQLLRSDLDTWRTYWRQSPVRVSLGRPPYPLLTISGLSYGSVVAGHAATGAGTDTAGKPVIDNLVLLGSPGSGLRAKHLDANLFVGANDTDFVSMLDWFSIDPSHNNYGSNVTRMKTDYRWTLEEGLVGNLTKAHTSYYNPDTESLTNISRVVTGRPEEVSREEQRTRPILGGHRSIVGRAFTNPPAKSRKKRDTEGNTQGHIPEPDVRENSGGKKKPRPDAVKRPIKRDPALQPAQPSGAQKPPTVLYRVDTRPPSEIFAEGFSSYGKDLDLEKHARGATTIGNSREAKSSGFVATTSNRNFAVRFSEQLLSDKPTVYLYEIVPNRSFYDLRSSLQAKGGVDPSLVEHAQVQGEWVSTGRIPPDHIKSVTPLSRPASGRGAPVAGATELNEKVPGTVRKGFDSTAKPEANRHPFGKVAPGTGAAAGGIRRYVPGADLVGPAGQRFLYRGDHRAPKSGILINGFSSNGFDVAEHPHLSGDMEKSAFISTTWSKETARGYAGSNGWIYKIDKNKLGTVLNVYGSSGLTGAPIERAIRGNMEVAAMYYIPPEAIVDAEPVSMRSQPDSLGSRVRHRYAMWQSNVADRQRPWTKSVRTGVKAGAAGILIAEKLFEIFPELRDVFAPLNSWIDEKWSGAQRAVQDWLMPDLARARRARELYDAIPKRRYAEQRAEWKEALWKVPGNTGLYGHPLGARVEDGKEITSDDVKNLEDALNYSTARVWADENLDRIKLYFARKIQEDEDSAGGSSDTLADMEQILRSITPEIVADEYTDHRNDQFAEIYALHTERYTAEKTALDHGRKVTINISVDSAEETQVLVPNAGTSTEEITWAVNGRAASRFKQGPNHPTRYKHGLKTGDTAVFTGVLPEKRPEEGLLRIYNPITRYQPLFIYPQKQGNDTLYVFLLPHKEDGSLAGVRVRVEGGGHGEWVTDSKALSFPAGVPLQVKVVYPGRSGSSELPADSLEAFPFYRVQRGDTLRRVAASKLGHANRWHEIYEINKDVIGATAQGHGAATVGQVWRMPESDAEANRRKVLAHITRRLNDPAFTNELKRVGDSSWAGVAAMQHSAGIINYSEMHQLVDSTSAQNFTAFLGGKGKEITDLKSFKRLERGYRVAFVQTDRGRRQMIHAMLSLSDGEFAGLRNGALKVGLPDTASRMYPYDDGLITFTAQGAELSDGRRVQVFAESAALFS